MKKYYENYENKLAEIPVNQTENWIVLGMIALFFLGIAMRNNPIFSFTYNQGLSIAVFVFIGLILMFPTLIKEKALVATAIIWFAYSAFLNLFVNQKGIDVAFILKMPFIFGMYGILREISFTKKFYQQVTGVILIALPFFMFKLLQVLFLGYNLTINKENSSIIGMAIAFSVLFFVPIMRYKINLAPKWKNLLIAGYYLLSLIMTFLFGARTLVIIILFYAVLDYLLPQKWKKSPNFLLVLFTLIFIFGLLFPPLYTYLLKQSEYLSDKDILTGRQTIWGHLFEGFFQDKKVFFFGYGIDRQYGRWPHEHNGMWSILMRYGTIGLLGYFGYWFFQIKQYFKKHEMTLFKASCLLSILAVLVMSYTEPVIGVADYFVPVTLLFAFALNKKEVGDK